MMQSKHSQRFGMMKLTNDKPFQPEGPAQESLAEVPTTAVTPMYTMGQQPAHVSGKFEEHSESTSSG